MRNAENTTLHLAHPKPIPCNEILRIVAEELSLRLCSPSDWISLLKTKADNTSAPPSSQKMSSEKLNQLPALKLLEFLAGALQRSNEHSEAMGLPKLDVCRASEASQALREACALGKSDVCRWLHFWKESGFIGKLM